MVSGNNTVRPGLNLMVFLDPSALAVAAADLIAAQVRARPELSILVATGSTPMATYAELARRVQAGTLDMGRVTAVQLDEYLGLEAHDSRSLWSWMKRSFVAPLGVTRTLRLDAAGSDPQRACADYDAALTALGGIDLAVLGLGSNGHLGFNEPPSPASAPTRAVDLTPQSRASNRAYWGQDVPGQALTAGMNVILAARTTLLLVTGAHKRGVLRRVLGGPQTPDLPASLLAGEGVSVLADRAALGLDELEPGGPDAGGSSPDVNVSDIARTGAP